ncbi:hypothetical protein ACFXC8_00270 [Streptomyces sp. NPDC059441]|uniref:hypothetical protein n=1 Tax=Streptomyces sp. NPDC059441 TaxID=3346829 RepID=UPI0036D1FE5F
MPDTTRYRQRPNEVDAIQWTGDNADALRAFAGQRFFTIDPEDRTEDPDCDAQLLAEASHWVGIRPGDWVLRFEGYFIAKADVPFRAVWEPAVPAAVSSAPADRAPGPTDEDVLVAIEEALERVLLPDPGFSVLEAARNAVLSALGPFVARLRLDRDLAIAHDRQPYPTAWAYEQACKAVRRKTEAIERVRSVLESEAVVGRSALDYRGLITSALMADDASGPSRAADEAQQPETQVVPYPPEASWQIETRWHDGAWRSWALRTDHDEAVAEFGRVQDGKHAWRLVRFHTTTAVEAEHEEEPTS